MSGCLTIAPVAHICESDFMKSLPTLWAALVASYRLTKIEKMVDPKITAYSVAISTPHCFFEILCDGYTVSQITSFEHWVSLLRTIQKANTERFVLASLDDFTQASYTCGHGIDSYELDEIEGYDLSGVDASAFENGEHNGMLSTASEFFIRHENLLKFGQRTNIEDAFDKLRWWNEFCDPAAANRDPDAELRLVKERDLLIQLVPVPKASDALAAFPNGYFTDDMNPGENFLIARMLEEQFGLRLFAVGATYLAFWRDEVIDPTTADSISEHLVRFYKGAPPGGNEAFAASIAGKDTLLFRYSQ